MVNRSATNIYWRQKKTEPCVHVDLTNPYGPSKPNFYRVSDQGLGVLQKIQFKHTGAPGYFQFFIHKILLGHIGKDPAVYLENIMADTRKLIWHKQVVSKILGILRKHNLQLKSKKFEFSKSKVGYLCFFTPYPLHQIQNGHNKVTVVFEW